MVRMPSLINLGVAAVLGTIVGSMKLLNRDRSAHRSRPWVAVLLVDIDAAILRVDHAPPVRGQPEIFRTRS